MSCSQRRRAVPAVMSYGEGTGLRAALCWGRDSKFMFCLLEETGLLLQSATSQMDVFLPPRGIQMPPKSFSLPSNSGEGGRDVPVDVNRVDVALECKPLGRVWGEKGASAIWAVPAESRDRAMRVCEQSGSSVGIPPAQRWGASREGGQDASTKDGERGWRGLMLGVGQDTRRRRMAKWQGVWGKVSPSM